MKKHFPSYYRLTDDEFTELWKNCTFFIDANVLLNFYRYPNQARSDLFRVFKLIDSRLVLPHQAALEYQANRLQVIAQQLGRFKEVRDVLNKTQSTLHEGLAGLQLKKRHSSIDPDGLLEQIRDVFNNFTKELDLLEKKQPDVFSEDKIREQIDNLFDRNIGKGPSTQAELDKLYDEAKKRYELGIPPGFRDIKKGKSGQPETSHHVFNGLAYKREYGDYLVWNEIIQESKERNLEYVIFITDDDKDDWWWIEKSKGDKTIGPRPELIEEIMQKTNVKSFYMYNSERFLEYSKKYLGVRIKNESIKQVREISEAQKTSNTRSFLHEYRLVEQAVMEWIKTIHFGYELSSNTNHDFGIDFLIDIDNNKIGYEIKWLRGDRYRIGIQRIFRDNWIYKAHYQIENGYFDKVEFVLVVDNEDALPYIKSQVNNHSFNIPHNMDLAINVGKIIIEEDEENSTYKFIFLEKINFPPKQNALFDS